LLAPRVSSFEEEDGRIREAVSEVFSAKRDYYSAASTLAGSNIEGGSRKLTVDDKAQKYVQIAEYYLEAGEPVEAEIYNNRASSIIHNVQDFPLVLRNKVCHARILDSRREYLQAARSYYALSTESNKNIMESDLIQLLTNSATCAILASAGPARSRLLATLYKDERSN